MASLARLTSPPAPAPQPSGAEERTRLGRGRSGIVYAQAGTEGYELACKVFLPDRASSLVMGVLTGAPNPYRWSRAAVEAAVCRRRILERLVPWWFPGHLRLPRTAGAIWNPEHRAYELQAERIDGRHALLRPPLAAEGPSEARELVTSVLRPLQAHLQASGFDGLLWQAGLGNPVAAANFMREERPDASARWVWIDLESGVPALFPFQFWRLFTHYLPLGDKHGHWLFDDVDIPALERYCRTYRDALLRHLGPRSWNRLCRDVRALAAHQTHWRALDRTQRGVSAHLAAGRIDRDQARHYWRRPLSWAGRVVIGAAARLPGAALRAGRRVARALCPKTLLAGLSRWTRFFASQQVRSRWAARHARLRVRSWAQRGFLPPAAAARIRMSAQGSEAAEYLADFGVCLAIKPLVKSLQYGLVPLLYALGAIQSGWLTAALILAGGVVGRSLYTGGRCLQSLARGRPAPWVALLAGLVPVAGNAAYPLQLLWNSSGEEGHLARFLVHDTAATVGRHVPIWGGRDTLSEHAANEAAHLLLRVRRPA